MMKKPLYSLRIFISFPAFRSMSEQIQYSDRYRDNEYEYRHVILPLHLARLVPRNNCMTETEWRNLGVQQSQGWVHYMLHDPEPHVICFRRKLETTED